MTQVGPGQDRWHLPDFNTQFLLGKGFRLANKSCAVLHLPDETEDDRAATAPQEEAASGRPQQRRPRIIALFVNGHTIPSLSEDVAGHHALYDAMSETYNSSDDRPGLYMTGLRCNSRRVTAVLGGKQSPHFKRMVLGFRI